MINILAKYPFVKQPETYTDQYYYLLDMQIADPKPMVIGVSKEITEDDLQVLQKKYITRPTENTQYFDALFLDKDIDINHKYFRFLIIEQSEEDHYEAIKSTFIALYDDAIVFKVKADIIVIYFDEEEITNQHILSISDDLGFRLKTFGGRLRVKNSGLFAVYNMYRKYFYYRNYTLLSLNDLLLEVIKYEIDDFYLLREIILGDCLKDYQLEQVLQGMFANDLNVSQTAIDIYMHRNTINNKLDLITAKTGLNPRRFVDAVTLYLLIKLKKWQIWAISTFLCNLHIDIEKALLYNIGIKGEKIWQQ